MSDDSSEDPLPLVLECAQWQPEIEHVDRYAELADSRRASNWRAIDRQQDRSDDPMPEAETHTSSAGIGMRDESIVIQRFVLHVSNGNDFITTAAYELVGPNGWSVSASRGRLT